MCGCKPGKEETGWQEIRCKECKEKEQKSFNRLVAQTLILSQAPVASP